MAALGAAAREPGTMAERHNLISYLATLAALVILALSGALVCVLGVYDNEVNIAKVIGALSFIGAAISGLIGVLGTFKGRQNGLSEDNSKAMIDKMPPNKEEPSK